MMFSDVDTSLKPFFPLHYFAGKISHSKLREYPLVITYQLLSYLRPTSLQISFYHWNESFPHSGCIKCIYLSSNVLSIKLKLVRVHNVDFWKNSGHISEGFWNRSFNSQDPFFFEISFWSD